MDSQSLKKPKRRVGVPNFLNKTHGMLELPEYQEYCAWVEEGEAFAIKDTKQFATHVLPNYFKHSNYQSFLRQLNMYSFIKKREVNGWTIFRHRFFKRQQQFLLGKIKRRNNGQIEEDVMDIPSIFTTKDLQNELDYYSMDNQNTYDDLRRLNSENEQVKQLIQTFGVQCNVLQNKLAQHKQGFSMLRDKSITEDQGVLEALNFVNSLSYGSVEIPSLFQKERHCGTPKSDPTFDVFVKEENSGDEKKASPINIGGATQNGSYVLVNSSLLQELIQRQQQQEEIVKKLLMCQMLK